MKNLIKKLRLRQVITVFLVGIILCISTACNRGDIRGARPDNPPVQAGGQNNPYKMGGDENTKYKFSPDPNVKSGTTEADSDQANQQLTDHLLIAAHRTDNDDDSGLHI